MNKSIRNLVLIGVGMIFFGSCQDKVILSYYETGEKNEEYQYIADSIKNGYYRKYSPKGLLLETANYVDGKLDGERIIYNYESGVIEVSEIYKNDKLEGRYIVYHTNGEIQSFGMYKNNVLSGTVKFYDTTGLLKNESQFVNNYEIIPFTEYFENGNIKVQGTKRYDHYFGTKYDYGELKIYNEKGELIRKIMCDEKEICTTIWSKDMTK